MEKITFQLPDGAKVEDLEIIAKSYKLDLKRSTQRGATGIFWLDVLFESLSFMGSIASLLSLFLYIKEKYGKSGMIKIEILIDGEMEERSLYSFINYLSYLKNRKMIQLISNKELASVVDNINIEWGIKASLKEAKFSTFPLCANPPQEGNIYFPKRFVFNILLYRIIQKGWNNHDSSFYGNQLFNLNEMIVGALDINDSESAEKLKQRYFKLLDNLSRQLSTFSNLDYNINNTLLFLLYHELTHVRIAQQPSFLESKREELSLRISNAQHFVRKSMISNLKKFNELEEEVICDLEACKKLYKSIKGQIEIKDTLSDIVNTLNILNNISNLRDAYVRTNISMFKTYRTLTHSTNTNMSIARFIFIQNFWKDDLILSGKEIMSGIFSSSFSLSLTQEAKDFCKAEFKKSDGGFFNPDRRRAKEIEEEIYEAEQSFIKSLMTPSDSL